MATRTQRWEFLFKIRGGHKYYRDRETGRIAVADDSGKYPNSTYDYFQGGGVLYVRTEAAIRFGQLATVACDREGHPGQSDSIIESPEGGLVLAHRLGMRINAGGFDFHLEPVPAESAE